MISIFNGSTRGFDTAESTTFVQVHHRILHHLKAFTASEWMVFTALALHMDANGFCFPSIDGISSMTGLSESTVRRCLHSLREVKINGRFVLAVRDRYDHNGRQTSNGYFLFPDSAEGVKTDRVEGVTSDREEGVKTDTPMNKNQKDPYPQGTKLGRPRRQTSLRLPDSHDPGRLIYEAYRGVSYPELEPSDFNIAEWAGARHIVYQMHHKGITPSDVETAATNLIRKWGNNRDMVTIHALWKHWSVATTGAVVTEKPMSQKAGKTIQDIGSEAVDVFRRVSVLNN